MILVHKFQGNVSTRTPSAPCASIFLHYRIVLRHNVEHYKLALIGNSLAVSLAIHLVNGKLKRISTLCCNLVKLDGHVSRSVEDSWQRLVKLHLARTIHVACRIAVAERLNAIIAMVLNTKSKIGGCVHLSIHGSYLRDIGSIGLNARNVNFKSRRTNIRLILPFHVSARCMEEESCLTLILNQNHWIFSGRAYRIHVERIAHIQSIAVDSVRSSKSG